MKYPQPNLTNIWAEVGAISIPSSLKISEGWVTEIPPCEQANFIENRQDKALAYVLQMGVPEWNAATEYQPESYITYNQVLYKSKGVNTNKQPNTNPLNWGIAFDVYGSADAVQQELDALLLDADPFDQYALKAAPVFTGKAVGTSYAAGTGLPTDNLSDVGHSFVADGDTGMFKDGNDIVFAVNTIERGRLRDAPLILEDDSKTLATTEWVRQLLAELTRIKVGDLYLTTNNYATPAEVSASKGYGVWQRHAEGRAIVGFSSDPTTGTPDWYKAVNSTHGAETTVVGIENMPAHNHTMNHNGGLGVLDQSSSDTQGFTGNPSIGTPAGVTNTTGGGQPLTNVQPSIVVAIWKRIA